MKHLVMLGTGHAHIHLLSILAAQPFAGVQVTLVAPYPNQVYLAMVAGFVAGHYALQDCEIALTPLLKNSGVTWRMHSATGLDAQAKTITLDDGSVIAYDVLSVNNHPMQDRARIEQMMPGARAHALFLRPTEAFCALWPKVLEFSCDRALRVAVIGGGAAGIELACSVAYCLKGASVTLLAGDTPVAAKYTPTVQARVIKTLRNRHITLIQERAIGVVAGEVSLANGARLACDVPIITLGRHPPMWLKDSDLALDDEGFMALDACLRSTSHPQIFAASQVSTRIDHQLANNLRAVLAGIEPTACSPHAKTLNFLACDKQSAIASWGNWSAQGRWVWWFKDWIDRRYMKKFSTPTQP